MSSQYGRLAETRDKARPIAPDETVEVYAADLDAVLTHYAEISNELVLSRAAPEWRSELLSALRRIADVTADDGDDFAGYDEAVIIRVEMTAGDLRAVRDAIPAISRLETAARVLLDFALDVSEAGDQACIATAKQVLGLASVRSLTPNA